MFCRVSSVMVQGIRGCLIHVETNVCDGLPNFIMVGYLSCNLKEAKERVQTAIRNSGYFLPPKHITVNLAPADIRKDGSSYDLSIAIGILAATGYIHNEQLEEYIIIGELSLDGHVNQVHGIMPMVLCGKESGYKKCIVPVANYAEAILVEDMEVLPINNLRQLVDYLNIGDRDELPCIPGTTYENVVSDSYPGFSEIYGQDSAKRAAEIAAAGMHNLLLSGPPGSGKTMIAKKMPTIMPPLTRQESLELTKIYSVSGMLNKQCPLIEQRPFRAPHHTITGIGLVGGGRFPKPGEISFAHHGVLFLDELPEYNRNVLQLLRQPLEEHAVTIVRNDGVYEYPANFILIAAMNPCPCGYFPDQSKCSCTIQDIRNYQNRISHALLDRIDMKIQVVRVSYEQLRKYENHALSSESIKVRVCDAVEIQRKRFREESILFNSEMNGKLIKKYCQLSLENEELLKKAFYQMNLSARGLHRTLRVARTIADLERENNIEETHLIEALSYRITDMQIGG